LAKSGKVKVKVNNEEIVLVSNKGAVHAVQAKCPHQGMEKRRNTVEAKAMAIETQSLRPLRPNLKEFKWLRVFGPQYRVSIHMTIASHG